MISKCNEGDEMVTYFKVFFYFEINMQVFKNIILKCITCVKSHNHHKIRFYQVAQAGYKQVLADVLVFPLSVSAKSSNNYDYRR